MNKPHIYGLAWFTERPNDDIISVQRTVGVVLAWTDTREHRAFIGVATGHLSDKEDAKKIALTGAPFPLSEAKSIINNFGEEVNILL